MSRPLSFLVHSLVFWPAVGVSAGKARTAREHARPPGGHSREASKQDPNPSRRFTAPLGSLPPLVFCVLVRCQAFEKHCRLPVAFGSLPNVNDLKAQPDDRMESFFLAETLKYLYLIQDPNHQVTCCSFLGAGGPS